ncbi:MAG TPA: DUF1801 domain-containing protein [Prolixibacteraceae bacterium]|nr:DUF1801 domain-containing protein [Prolixibacteraceae bacterium]
MKNINEEVTKFLDQLNHPLRAEIEELRLIILNSIMGLTENIKWNAPNYCFDDQDRVTMRIQPPKQIQLIFHRGAKKVIQPKDKLMEDKSGLLVWKENDRAIATFKNMNEIKKEESNLGKIINSWISAAK